MHFFLYILIRFFGFFISHLPYSLIHLLGNSGGFVAFYIHRPFRKKALANLEIAYREKLSEKRKRTIAIRSFQNLMITCLEFFKLKRDKKKLSKIVQFEGGEEVFKLLENKQGIIFLTGHQANWEIPFITLSERFAGIAIGRPINNPWLYRWVLSVREMCGGKIVMPRNAIRQGLRALREGKFVGIVGDQAFPDSPYSYPLFGTRAWTTTTPALLAFRTGCPIVVGATRREGHKYIISGSCPLWPDLSKPRDEEVVRLMDQAMSFLEKSIEKRPHEWMWQHDRWKQHGIDHIKRQFRYGFVLILLPPHPEPYIPLLPLLQKIYNRSFLTIYAPQGSAISLPSCEVIYYSREKELYAKEYRHGLVLDFYDSLSLRRHYKKLGAFETLNVKKMQKIAQIEGPLDELMRRTFIKKECRSDAIS